MKDKLEITISIRCMQKSPVPPPWKPECTVEKWFHNLKKYMFKIFCIHIIDEKNLYLNVSKSPIFNKMKIFQTFQNLLFQIFGVTMTQLNILRKFPAKLI